MSRFKLLIVYFFLFIAFCCQSLWMHKNFPEGHWRNELRADKAGYYLYLPAIFIYHFNAEEIPPEVEKMMGNSFHLDTKNNKIVDKYFCTVSIMEMPFFLAAHVYAINSEDYEPDGFSLPYQKAIDIAACFYMALGLFLLHLSLLKFFNIKPLIVVITLLLIFIGTNFYFYGIMDTGMSHIYSFFLFSSVLYLLVHRDRTKDVKFNVLLSIVSWAIIMVRPLNLFFLIIILVWEAGTLKGVYERWKEFYKPRTILIWLVTGVFVCGPQLAYWYYIRGDYLYWTYGKEGFTNILSPKIAAFLFAPNNGWLPYSFIGIFMLAGIFILAKQQKFIAWTTGIIFLLVVYFSASWCVPNFGCGCGQRNLVEYYSLLAIPLCAFVNYIYSLRKKYIYLSVLFLIAFLNFKIVYHYWGCYFYDTWDWKYYNELVRYNNKNWGPYN